MIDVFFRLYNPFPPLHPRRPLHMLYIYITTFNCPNGILGLGGEKHLMRRYFWVPKTYAKDMVGNELFTILLWKFLFI